MEAITNGEVPDQGSGIESKSPWRLQTHGSKMVEQALEYQLLAELTAGHLRRGVAYEVLRGDFDTSGYDVVMEAKRVTRHIQLKACILGGKASSVPIHTALASSKPSGCVVRMRYDPGTLSITEFGWFGDEAGHPLPPLGDRVVKHSRGNSSGVKAPRPSLRSLPASKFSKLQDAAGLLDKLFG